MTFHTLIREFNLTDDIDFLGQTEDDMQRVVDLIAAFCTAFG